MVFFKQTNRHARTTAAENELFGGFHLASSLHANIIHDSTLGLPDGRCEGRNDVNKSPGALAISRRDNPNAVMKPAEDLDGSALVWLRNQRCFAATYVGFFVFFSTPD